MTEIEVRHVPDDNRYEALIDGHVVGVNEYHVNEGVISFTHAGVDPSMRGQGIASEMVRATLDDIREQGGFKVRPLCSFVRWYIDQNPEYADLRA